VSSLRPLLSHSGRKYSVYDVDAGQLVTMLPIKAAFGCHARVPAELEPMLSQL
jgi:hypothetical protein